MNVLGYRFVDTIEGVDRTVKKACDLFPPGVYFLLIRRLLRCAYSLLYNQLACFFDTIASLVSLGQWQEWGQQVFPFLEGALILDLAHGTGNLLSHMIGAGFDPVGIDSSPSMGRIAWDKLESQNLPAPLVRGLAQRLPFQTESFDSVVCTFPAEFILHPATLGEVARVLATGGVFILVPAANVTGKGVTERLMGSALTATGQRSGTLASLLLAFKEAGLDGKIRWVRLPNSLVMLIVAKKQAPY